MCFFFFLRWGVLMEEMEWRTRRYRVDIDGVTSNGRSCAAEQWKVSSTAVSVV